MTYDFAPCSTPGLKARAPETHLCTSAPEAPRIQDSDHLRRYPGPFRPSPLPEFLKSTQDEGRHWDIGTRFGQRLRELRHNQRMTQIDMAVMLGIDRSYISEVERGKKGISLATLEIIAIGFRLHLSELLRDL